MEITLPEKFSPNVITVVTNDKILHNRIFFFVEKKKKMEENT